jgi:predicted RNA-binding protein associated with RNAse of E/G family
VKLDDTRVKVTDERPPDVLEVLCDGSDTALDFDEVEDALRREVLLTIGAR